MLHPYHISILKQTLGPFFTPAALKEIIDANLGQDGLTTLIGHDHIHCDDSKFKEARAYIETQHTCLAQATNPKQMRAALGRLTHGAQDFYAHSNYVELWLRHHGGLQQTQPEEINGLDPQILKHPELCSGNFYWWRDFIYYVPGLRHFAQRYLVFEGSHEAMHLDDPSRGFKFYYAFQAAKQRTLAEYHRALRALSPEQVALFHDQQSEVLQPRSRPIFSTLPAKR